MNTYKVKVPNFEGPLDLLLFFIKRDELDIYNIPISHITKEFLDYVRFIQMLDLELAGEFIVIAAMLMQIKVRMMLPHPVTDGEEEEEKDPRAELVRRLLEYKRYKEVSEEMKKMEEEQRRLFFRNCFQADVRKKEEDEENLLSDVSMFDLIKAFTHVIVEFEKRPVHQIQQIPYTIEDQAKFIVDFFRERSEYNFLEMISIMQEKMQVVVTFIALLELIRAHQIKVITQAQFNDFRIIKTEPLTEEISKPVALK